MNVKIIGAGSIGNHLAHAARSLGWHVTLCDVDQEALHRTQHLIYPSRYGKWDDSINLQKIDKPIRGKYDLILIGTPPQTHLEIALNECQLSNPKAIMIEKPLTTPKLKGMQQLFKIIQSQNTKIFIGYDHILSNSLNHFLEQLKVCNIGKVLSIDVNFRENWSGIFNAHSWLDGPSDSYLGFSSKGGGALCEHSHGLSMWIFLSNYFNYGKISEVSAQQKFYKDDKVEYDEISYLNLKTNKGLFGRVVQDVTTVPVKKEIIIFGENGIGKLNFATVNEYDTYEIDLINEKKIKKRFKKLRPDDFINELSHIRDFMENKISKSPIDIKHGIETMIIIKNAFESSKNKKTIKVDLEEMNQL